MKNPFRRPAKAPEFEENDLSALRDLRLVERIPSPRHLPRFSFAHLSKQIIGIPEANRRLFGQISRQDALPADARRLKVRSIGDGHFSAMRRSVFTSGLGDIPVDVVCLEDAIVTPRGFVIHGSSLVWDAHALGPNWHVGEESLYLVNELAGNNLGGYDAFCGEISHWNAESYETLEAPAFLFNAGLATVNFAHLIHDTIAQVPTFHECTIQVPDLVPFMPGAALGLPISEEILTRTMGRHAERRVFGHHRFWRVKKLYVPTPLFDDTSRQISRGAMLRMRSLLDVALAAHPASPPRDLFISRTKSSRGQHEPSATNYGAFLELLEKRGFTTIDASEIAGPEYFDTFRGGRIFIGLHGAGLLNSMLAPHARLIELSVPGTAPWVIERFGLLARGADMPFVKVPPKTVDGQSLELDLPAIDAAITALREDTP